MIYIITYHSFRLLCQVSTSGPSVSPLVTEVGLVGPNLTNMLLNILQCYYVGVEILDFAF